MGESARLRTAAGVGLYVEVDGAEDASVTLLLVSGWTLDTRSWEPVTRALTGPDRPPLRVIRYDHRGHGHSDTVAKVTMTIEALADDLAELISALVPAGPVVLGGHSMGGMTIMALAQRHPELVADRVAGVAFVSTASGGLADTTLGLSVRMLGAVRRCEKRLASSDRFDRRAVLSRWPKVLEPGVRWLLLGRGADAGALAVTARCAADCRPSTMVGFRPTLDAHDRDAALAAFAHVPTEVLVGTRDKLTPVAQSRRIVASAPWARLTLYPNAGHMLPLERVDGVSARIAGLVARARTERASQRAERGTREASEEQDAGAAEQPGRDRAGHGSGTSRGSRESRPAPATPGWTSARPLPRGARPAPSPASTAR